MNDSPENDIARKHIPFRLDPGDQVTEAFALWAVSDRIAEELGKCCACDGPTFRVVMITSAAKLEKRAALCGRHFAMAAKAFTQLNSRSNTGAD
jgi:hypothetical protein